MTDAPPDADVSAPATCTFTPDGLDVLEVLDVREILRPDMGCSRPVWEEADGGRCVWHADGEAKPPDELAATVEDGNLTGARARESDLTTVPFPEGSNLVRADLSEADLRGANLSGADLENADLSEADLRDADLRNTHLADTTLADVSLARSTTIGDPAPRIREEGADSDLSGPALYDTIARTNHELRAAYSHNGLTGRARRARVRERKARRREARAEGGWGWVAWGWSVLSQVFTGYGIQVGWILGVMSVLYVGSAVVYWAIGGMTPAESLYYSIVTFTTSPPGEPPTGAVMRAMAGIETFAGTAAIVFLGYVLGTREQV